jgi:hypothetical protein
VIALPLAAQRTRRAEAGEPSVSRSKLRILLVNICVIITLGLLILAAIDKFQAIAWIGAFPLDVRLHALADRKVVRIWYGYTRPRSAAKEELNVLLAEFNGRPVHEFKDGESTVDIKCIGRSTGLGREITYGEGQVLILKFEYEDGEIQYKVVEIPPGRGRRSVTVEIP